MTSRVLKRTFRCDGKVTIRTDQTDDGFFSIARADKDIHAHVLAILHRYAERHGETQVKWFESTSKREALKSHELAVQRFDQAMIEYTFGDAA